MIDAAYVVDNLDSLPSMAMEEAAAPSVYIIRDKKGVVKYVGKAKYLMARLGNHISCFMGAKEGGYFSHQLPPEALECRVYWLTVSSEAEALDVEGDLILKFQPEWNKSGKGIGRAWFRSLSRAQDRADRDPKRPVSVGEIRGLLARLAVKSREIDNGRAFQPE